MKGREEKIKSWFCLEVESTKSSSQNNGGKGIIL
jgi:hypothetical protein